MVTATNQLQDLLMYQLYIANKNYSSWSLRPWLLLTELGIDFTEQQTSFDGPNNHDKFRGFAPNGKVPCLHHDGEVIWESLAIIEYLAEQHVGVWPAAQTARAFARSAASEMHAGFTALRSTCPMSVGVRIQLHQVSPALQADLDRLSELWQQGLQRFGGPFLAGNTFTAVDAFFAPVAFRAQSYGLPLPSAAQAYVELLLSLPGMHAWQQAALQESAREPSHEAAPQQHGVLTADLRHTST
jgi:glutathione S-transferase